MGLLPTVATTPSLPPPKLRRNRRQSPMRLQFCGPVEPELLYRHVSVIRRSGGRDARRRRHDDRRRGGDDDGHRRKRIGPPADVPGPGCASTATQRNSPISPSSARNRSHSPRRSNAIPPPFQRALRKKTSAAPTASVPRCSSLAPMDPSPRWSSLPVRSQTAVRIGTSVRKSGSAAAE